jgi:Zn-dependent M28 family amino/carboxypeptidase
VTDQILAHLRALIGERHPHTSRPRLLAAEQYLVRTFRQSGYHVDRHAFDAMGGTYHNVIAYNTVAGSNEPPLLIGAHYDTVPDSPGADDNASALAVLLECARTLSSAAFRRPIHWVAFCLEEADLLGSRAYVNHLKRTGKPVAGAVILECVGYARSEKGTQQAPPRVPIAVPTVGNFLALVGNQAATALVSLLATAGRRAVPELPLIPLVVPGGGEQLPDTRRSDHAAFWDEGYPAIMLTDTANFRNPHYHRPTDTLDTLNIKFIEQVARLVIATVRDWAGEDHHGA